MSNETYQGWTNHETWAFNLHWQNDQGLYDLVREWGQELIDRDDETTDLALGEAIIERLKDLLEEIDSESTRMVLREVGSFWRVDNKETGAAVRESIVNG